MRRLKFKSKAVIISACALLALAGGAYAYFSTSGSGSVTASVGTSSAVAINASLSPTTFYPGSSSTATFTVTNSSSQSQHVNQITLASVHACPQGDTWQTGTSNCSNSGTEITSCETVETGASDTNTASFWMAPVTENQNFAANTSNNATSNGGTVEMNNLSSSQDACKNASLYLTFTSN